ncbi:MAG TPA: phosphotransferase [Acidimicrobiales bacterium]|nr:phosphotransferase [Acidimicrobiales bacterium]
MIVEAEAVADIAARHLGTNPDDEVRFLGQRDFNTWEVGGEFILRFAVDDESDAAARREVAVLPHLASVLEVEVPRFDFVDTFGEGYRVVGYRKVQGLDGEDYRIGAEERPQLVQQFARLLKSLHAVPGDAFEVDIPLWSPAEPALQVERIVRYASVIREQVPELVTPSMAEYLGGRVALPRWEYPLVVAHADLKGEHLLFESGRLHAVIDWADICLTDPAVDLGALATCVDPIFVREVGAAYGASEATIERALFFSRAYMLVGLGRLLTGKNHWPKDLVSKQVARAFAEGHS